MLANALIRYIVSDNWPEALKALDQVEAILKAKNRIAPPELREGVEFGMSSEYDSLTPDLKRQHRAPLIALVEGLHID